MQRLIFSQLQNRQLNHHIAVTRLSVGSSVVPHEHDFFEFLLVRGGSGLHHINGSTAPLSAGWLVFVQPTDQHWFSTENQTGLQFVNVAIPARWWKQFLSLDALADADALFERGQPKGHVQAPPHWMQPLNMALDRLLSSARSACALVETCVWVTRIFEHASESRLEVLPAWLTALEQDLHRPDLVIRDLKFWYRRIGRSPEHIARSCRKHLGAPLTELLNRARIEHAQRLLHASDEKVTTVAWDAGYRNLGYFHRTFRKYAGCTPSEWRRHAAPATVPISSQ